jgi:mannose PTS system EIIA component
MLGLLIIAHAPLASALRDVARHAFPESTVLLEALDVQADTPVEQVEASAAEMLQRVLGPDAIVFTDVFGATPCNVAQRIAALPGAGHIKVITGVNVPMLWRCLCYVHEPIEAVAARAVAGATQGVMQLVVPRPQDQATKPGSHDSNHAHHQQ